MNTLPFLLHALSPLHSGTGDAADIIDLPTARMKATGIPFVPGSSIKGVLRDERRESDAEEMKAVFGPLSDDAVANAGALAVGDARLLALPVRSFRGTFAWVTSPLLLFLARRDLGNQLPLPTLPGRAAHVVKSNGPGTEQNICIYQGRIFLEDIDLIATPSTDVSSWASALAPLASPGQDILTKRFVVVDDETMAFLWETGTQVDARVRLDQQTGTVAPGALWLEESLPPESLLIGLLAADRSRRHGVAMSPARVLAFALPGEQVLQLGGKASTGRGRCRIVPIPPPGRADG